MLSGAQWYRDVYLKSDHWLQLRLKALSRARNTCESCRTKEKLNVHHLKYDAYNEKPEYLMVLCKRCHDLAHLLIEKAANAIDPIYTKKYLLKFLVYTFHKHTRSRKELNEIARDSTRMPQAIFRAFQKLQVSAGFKNHRKVYRGIQRGRISGFLVDLEARRRCNNNKWRKLNEDVLNGTGEIRYAPAKPKEKKVKKKKRTRKLRSPRRIFATFSKEAMDMIDNALKDLD